MPWRATVAVAITGAAAGVAASRAQAGAQPDDGPVLSPLVGSPRERLEERAARQATSPSREAMESPMPPGAEAAMATGPSRERAGGAQAREELEAVLERAASLVTNPARGAGRQGPEPGDQAAFAATRLYVQARQKYLDNDYEGAVADLESAIELDPSAASLHVLLGEARLRSGDDEGGMASMARAVELGEEHPRPLLLLCTWNVTRGNFADAIHFGGRAVAADGMRDDPALRCMAWAALGDALQAGGYLRAAARAYTLGFDLPPAFPSGTAFTSELSSMYRGAWDALFRAALNAAAIEDWELAETALASAARFPGVDDARALPVRVLACMRAGRPASAALAILDTIERHGTPVDARARRLIRHLRDHGDSGPLLAAALTELDARVRGRSPAIESSLALAVAAGLPDGLDRGPLVDGVRRFPSDVALIAALLESFGPEEEPLAVRAASDLAAANPVFAQSVADAMISVGLRRPSVLGELDEGHDGGSLLLARLLIEAARFEEARGVLERVGPAEGDLGAARRFLAATLGSLAGNQDEARRGVEQWPTPENDGQRLLLVRSLMAVGEVEAAVEAAGDPSPTGEAGRALVWQACTAARSRGNYELTERLAIRLIEADPYQEDGYGVLIGLYSPNGPRADQARLGETVRTLRERVPDSGLLRFLSARELAQMGRLAEADARLRALAEDRPTDDAVLRALVDVWQMRQSREGGTHLAGGELFLQELAERHNRTISPVVTLGLMRLALNRAAESAQPVIAWLGRGLLTTAEDRNRLRSLIDPLLRVATTSPGPAAARAALLELWRAMDAAEVDLDPPMHQARLVLLTQAPPFDDAAIMDAAQRAADQVPAMDPAAYVAPAGRVLQGGRPDLALAMLKAAGERDAEMPREQAAQWVGLIAQQGDAEDLRDFLGLVTDAGVLGTILGSLPGAPDEAPAAIERLRADLAYSVAGATRVLNRPEEAGEGFLRLALELFPEHENAANDLGYQLAERGQDLDEAERLLEMAHRLRPDESNVLDSLGWLRYKQGRIADVVDASGAVVEPGAVTLLERAAAGLEESAGPVTHDQLGDALWRAGRQEDALARWREALPRAEQTVELYESAPALLLADAQQRLARIRAKIAAAEAGSEPEVAPLGEGVAGVR